MANNNYRTKKKSRFNVAGIIALIVAAAVTVTTLGVGTSGFKDWSFSRFFPKSEVQEQQPDDEQPDENEQADNTVITVSEEHGLKLMSATIAPENYAEYGVSTYAESAFSLTVTITPSNATYQSVDMTLKWKNPQSEWASGKSVSDYLTINQTSDGSLTATGTVLQAFSEPIEITATLRGQEEITAKAQVDYVGTLKADLYSCDLEFYDSDIEIKVEGIENGTIAPDLQDSLILTFNIAPHWVEGMQERGYTLSSSVSYTITPESINTVDPIVWGTQVLKDAGNKTSQSPDYHEYMEALSIVALGGSTAEDCMNNEYFTYCLDCNRVYKGETYDTVRLVDGDAINLYDWSGFVVPADSMSFDNSQIVVG